MEIENKTELMMILVALENSSELILKDPRAEAWHERVYVSLFNKVKEEYDQINETEELINLHHEYQELDTSEVGLTGNCVCTDEPPYQECPEHNG